MREWLQKLKSRKFLITVGTIALKTLAPETPDSVIIMAGTYVLGEGAVDGVRIYNAIKGEKKP